MEGLSRRLRDRVTRNEKAPKEFGAFDVSALGFGSESLLVPDGPVDEAAAQDGDHSASEQVQVSGINQGACRSGCR